ncbi:uncharacterized protein LOC108991452 isoform X1 [Juglans regia]|uniref:Uncharacterized protein LOC108991452 isoform X1 n=3 Tax=Juglans regia TaxID=51240 RepID=A0A2I4EPB8_JUGRE|nr:uncharacterized protein LOC108991452 isoform X1 [Juglans regia]
MKGSSKDSWHPVMSSDTTTPSYWLNWRLLLCSTWLLVSTVFAFILIWKNEGFPKRPSGETQQEEAGTLYEDETWRPCLKGIHPAWLLAFRVVGFFVLLVLLIFTALADGGGIFYFYTQWTFTLITIYFGLGSLLSMHGCYQHHKKASGDRVDNVEVDTELGTCDATPHGESSKMSNPSKSSGHHEQGHLRRPAGIWGYVFQIIFQMNAGAVMLTDSVFWFIIVPFLLIRDYELNFLVISMHTINAVFLLGDTALNCLRFPWFRMGYFCLWTVVYVIFQWIVHACVKLWWPYPFLDLSSPYAPLWYFSVALMHIPCYGIFALIMKLKHFVLSTKFPQSYQCMR